LLKFSPFHGGIAFSPAWHNHPQFAVPLRFKTFKIWKAKTFMPEYKDKIIFGAVAFLTADSRSDRMAEKLGFFVIKATGSISSIVNEPDFVPKAF
jgi:hypothetical protein